MDPEAQVSVVSGLHEELLKVAPRRVCAIEKLRPAHVVHLGHAPSLNGRRKSVKMGNCKTSEATHASDDLVILHCTRCHAGSQEKERAKRTSLRASNKLEQGSRA